MDSHRFRSFFGTCAALMFTATPPAHAALVGYWDFNTGNAAGGAGGIVDLAGGDHNATLNGGSFDSGDIPVPLAGAGSRSLNLTGSNNYAIVDAFSGLASENDLDGGSAITVSAWIKGWPNGDWEPFVSKRGESNQGWQLRRRSNSDNQTFTLRGTSGTDDPQGTINLNDGNWHHVVGTYSGGRRSFYVDGVLDLEIVDGGTVADTNAFVVFGARDNSASSGPHVPNVGNHSQIRLDDIAIWNEGLSPNQIAHLAAGGSPTDLPFAPHAVVINGFEVRTVDLDQTANAPGIGNTLDGLADAELLLALNPGDTGHAGETTANHNTINFNENGGTAGDFGGDSNFDRDGQNDNFLHFALEATGQLEVGPEEVGYWTFAVRSDDGFRLTIGDLVFDDTTLAGDSDTDVDADGSLFVPNGRGDGGAQGISFGTVFLPLGVHDLSFVWWQGGGGLSVELSAAMAPNANGFSSLTQGDFQLVMQGRASQVVIPEPATAALGLLSLGGLLMRRRRQA